MPHFLEHPSNPKKNIDVAFTLTHFVQCKWDTFIDVRWNVNLTISETVCSCGNWMPSRWILFQSLNLKFVDWFKCTASDLQSWALWVVPKGCSCLRIWLMLNCGKEIFIDFISPYASVSKHSHQIPKRPSVHFSKGWCCIMRSWIHIEPGNFNSIHRTQRGSSESLVNLHCHVLADLRLSLFEGCTFLLCTQQRVQRRDLFRPCLTRYGLIISTEWEGSGDWGSAGKKFSLVWELCASGQPIISTGGRLHSSSKCRLYYRK